MSSNDSLEKLMKRYSDELYKYNSIRKSKPSATVTQPDIEHRTASSQPSLDIADTDEYVTEAAAPIARLTPPVTPIAYNDGSFNLSSSSEDEYITEVSAPLSEYPPIDSQPESPSAESSRQADTSAPNKDGKILVQVFTARRTMPVPNAYVDIYYSADPSKKVVETMITDNAGRTEYVVVPAMPKELSEQPQTVTPYTTYNITATHPDFADVSVKDVAVFEGITAMLDIDMMPKNVAPNGESNDYVVIEPSDL